MAIRRAQTLLTISKLKTHFMFLPSRPYLTSSSQKSNQFQNVGFIGLGNMGARMVNNLVKAGYKVTVNDINRDVMRMFIEMGVSARETPYEVGLDSDVVITMLPSSSHVMDVYTGINGLLYGGNVIRPALLIDSSTIDPQTTRKISLAVSSCDLKETRDNWEKPVMLDAPVSGGVLAAEAATLTFMVGGPEDAYLAAGPILKSMGRTSIYCGGSGNGSAAKICNNLAMAVSMLGTSEALALGQSLGISASTLTEVLNTSSGRCWSSDTYNPVPGVMKGVPSSRDYNGGFASKLMAKDLNLAAASAEEVGHKSQLISKTQEIVMEIINEKFGVEASYTFEEVHVSSRSSRCLYRCHLQLPEFSVVSNVFKNKKDAQQSATELALEKLGIQSLDHVDDDITVEQAWDDIVERIKYIFSNEFISADHPLSSHIRATLQRDGERCGSVPVSVIATFDATINSRCRVINPSIDSDPILAMSYVMKAADKLSEYIVVSPHVASLRRKNPYPPEVIEALGTRGESVKVEGLYIQPFKYNCEREEVVDSVTLGIPSSRYYLDVIAEKLGLKDGSQLMISRACGKTSSGYECRVYSAIPKLIPSDKSSKAYGKRPVDETSSPFKNSWNEKASLVCGQDIHGDAIMASVYYPWRSPNLEHDDLTLKTLYRLCCIMSPNGIYKTLRKAFIAAHLPSVFTSKSSWRGPFPKEILCMFCDQQQLAEPIFTISTAPVKPMTDILRSLQKLKDTDSGDVDNEYVRREKEENKPVLENGYRCHVKILSKSRDVVYECLSRKFYEKENHAVQNASLNSLSWFSSFFTELEGDSLKPGYEEGYLKDLFEQKIWMKEDSSRNHKRSKANRNRDYPFESRLRRKYVRSIAKGSVVRLCYSVSLKVDADMSKNGESLEEVIESHEEIEFEVGNGSMNQELELVVTQMSVGQYVCFATDSPTQDLILAAAANTARIRSLSSELVAGLEYRVRLLGVNGPTEKQLEAACFKPPLSEQRFQYALKHIKESSASSLVDFGCGSGSLLDSLLDYPTSLQTIIGVDISQKRLARAAKMLPPKLDKRACNITLYDGSILECDSRLHDIDVATCLEVIEHMEENEAYQFGETVLSMFRPKLLIVSTPNYEYNRILHKPAQNQPKDNPMSHRSKFRNHDHKFERTRAQFNQWASKLAKRHNYSVKFSGVGGSSKVEPGFASQIAVFRQQSFSKAEKVAEASMQPYKVVWEWKKANGDKKE